MSSVILNGDILSLAVYEQNDAQVCVTVWHVKASAVVGGGLTDTTVAIDYSTALAAVRKPSMPIDCDFLGIRAQIISPTLKPAVGSQAGTGPGTDVADSLPSQTALVCKLGTGAIGRSRRGRRYIPSWSEGFNDPAGRPTNGALVAGAAFANLMTAPRVILVVGQGATFTGGVWSRLLLQFNQVTGIAFAPFWGTQRRRSEINRGDGFPTFP